MAVAAIMMLVSYYRPYSKTDEALHMALSQVVKLDSPPQSMELDIVDGWESRVLFKFKKEPKRLTYTVISRGPDKIEGTNDDITKESIDNNVSRIIGEWTADKAREFFKGVRDGLGKKSKYEEDF